MDLLRLIVQFTPTQKDDELLKRVETFLESNPELAPILLKLLIGLLRQK